MNTIAATIRGETPLALLQAPESANYQHYTDYLQDFRKYVDFLRNNSDVRAAPPVVRTAVIGHQACTKCAADVGKADTGIKAVESVPAARAKDEHSANTEPQRLTRVLGLPVRPIPVTKAPVKVDELPVPEGEVRNLPLLGKKTTRNRLQAQGVSDALGEHLRQTDALPRHPDELPLVERWVARRVSRKKTQLGTVHLRTNPIPPGAFQHPGNLTQDEFKALFESSSDEDHDSDVYHVTSD